MFLSQPHLQLYITLYHTDTLHSSFIHFVFHTLRRQHSNITVYRRGCQPLAFWRMISAFVHQNTQETFILMWIKIIFQLCFRITSKIWSGLLYLLIKQSDLIKKLVLILFKKLCWLSSFMYLFLYVCYITYKNFNFVI